MLLWSTLLVDQAWQFPLLIIKSMLPKLSSACPLLANGHDVLSAHHSQTLRAAHAVSAPRFRSSLTPTNASSVFLPPHGIRVGHERAKYARE